MGRTIQELAAIRDGVRRQWLLPVPGAFPGAGEIEETSEETLALLAKQRLFSAGLLRAIRSGNPAAIENARPRPPTPRPTGQTRTLTGGSNSGTANRNLSWGPLTGAFIIREIVFDYQSNAAAGIGQSVGISLTLTADDRSDLIPAPAGQRIWPAETSIDDPGMITTFFGTGHDSKIITPNKPFIADGGFLTFFVFQIASSAGGHAFAVAVTLEELTELSLGTLIMPPAGRTNLNPTTRPPVPRLPRPSTPRGAVVRVTQGGMILAQRNIAWEALDASLRAKWFNQQVGEPPDPSIQWIQ